MWRRAARRPISSAGTAASACLVAAAAGCIIIGTARGPVRLGRRSRWGSPDLPCCSAERSSEAPELTWHSSATGCRCQPSSTAFMTQTGSLTRWRDYLMTGGGKRCISAQQRSPHSYSTHGRGHCPASDRRRRGHPSCQELVPSSDCHRYWAFGRCPRTLTAAAGCMTEA